MGNAFFTYNLGDALAHEASLNTLEREAADEEAEGGDYYTASEIRIRITADRDMPQGVVVLRGAQVITMLGDDIIDSADIVVRNNRIISVGSRGTMMIPDDAEIIDVSGKTIIPGLVDTHAHMWPSWGVHKKQPWIYLANLAYGVTTTRDPQTARTDVISYADMVRSGKIIGPRVYSTGPGVFWLSLIHI